MTNSSWRVGGMSTSLEGVAGLGIIYSDLAAKNLSIRAVEKEIIRQELGSK